MTFKLTLFSVRPSVLLSVPCNKSFPTGSISLKYYIAVCFEKMSRMLQPINIKINSGTLNKKYIFLLYLPRFFQEWEFFRYIHREIKDTSFKFNKYFSENSDVYENMYNIIVWPDRPQVMVWPLCNSFWLKNGQNHTFRICNIYLVSTAKLIARSQILIALNLDCLYFVYYVFCR